MVDYNGLENRRTERYRGFESLSLRKQGCKSTSYVIYTLYYTQKFIVLETYHTFLLQYSFVFVKVNRLLSVVRAMRLQHPQI